MKRAIKQYEQGLNFVDILQVGDRFFFFFFGQDNLITWRLIRVIINAMKTIQDESSVHRNLDTIRCCNM